MCCQHFARCFAMCSRTVRGWVMWECFGCESLKIDQLDKNQQASRELHRKAVYFLRIFAVVCLLIDLHKLIMHTYSLALPLSVHPLQDTLYIAHLSPMLNCYEYNIRRSSGKSAAFGSSSNIELPCRNLPGIYLWKRRSMLLPRECVVSVDSYAKN